MTRINNQEQQYQKPSAGAIFGGIVAGSLVQNAAPFPAMPFAVKIVDKMKKISNLSNDEFKQVTEGINKTLKNTTLSEKGVTLKRIPTVEAKSFREKCRNTINPIKGTEQGNCAYYVSEEPKADRLKGFLEKFAPKELLEDLKAKTYLKAKTIVAPEKNLSLAIFHEIGHAANNHLDEIGKLLQKSRKPLMFIVTPLIGLVALCKTKKAPNQEPQGTMDKATDFIKNNAGKLTFLAFVPILAEEAIASIKGCKFAKEAGLSTELVAKVAKTNKIAYLTYLGSALLTSLGIYLGVKVKDAIAKPVPVNQN